MMKASDYIVEYLYQRGVTHIYEVIGGMITHLIDSAHRHGKIHLVSMHHEQAAAFAADASARMTGVPGVAMGTSGPGAVNLLTGIGSCYYDSVPGIFITGQVNVHEQKGNRDIRQLGFQETDIVGMAQPITKAAWRIKSADEIPSILEEAFSVAMSGRPGPVLLDIPMDVQRNDISQPLQVKANTFQPDIHLSEKVLKDVFALLRSANKPLLLVGGGVHAAGAAALAREFIDHLNVPVVSSLLAVDILPYSHPLRVGFIGSYGNRWANIALGTCDLLLVLGSRLDIRQTGADVAAFKGDRTIIHVDCELGELNNRVQGCLPVHSDLKMFLTKATACMQGEEFPTYASWKREIQNFHQKWPDTNEIQGIPGINPNQFMHDLSIASSKAGAFVVDVGNHQMWAAQSVEMGAHQRFLTSGGMGSMGFSLPAAIGVGFSIPGQPVLQICGDGGMQMNIQELQTIVHHHLPIKMVVLNNGSYGMVRQFQQSYFHERYASTYWGYSAPDFAKVAQAYGIPSASIDKVEEIQAGLNRLWEDPGSPFLLQVQINMLANVYPKIAFGFPITQMEPFAKPLDMEGT